MRYQSIPLACLTLLTIASAAPSPYGGQGGWYHHQGPANGQTSGNNQGGGSPDNTPSQGFTGGTNPGSTTDTPSPQESTGSTNQGSTNDTTTDGSTTTTPTNSSDTVTGQSVSTKKGCGVWGGITGLADKVTEQGCSWAYDWSANPANSFGGSAPSAVDLVPLLQSKTGSDISTVGSSSGKEILGWNEPDGSAGLGGNPFSASTAASLWPQVVATGKRVGSPAPANTKLTQGDWFYDFMSAIKEAGSHVDFICLHHYAPTSSVSELQQYIESVYNMYKLPIWVTEWADINYDQSPATVPAQSAQVSFMQEAAAMLDGLSYVERYAWFALPENANQPATYLYDSSGNISPMGTAYKAL